MLLHMASCDLKGREIIWQNWSTSLLRELRKNYEIAFLLAFKKTRNSTYKLPYTYLHVIYTIVKHCLSIIDFIVFYLEQFSVANNDVISTEWYDYI
jgi:penicillin-binding protein-related factor A (putative recombinase)